MNLELNKAIDQISKDKGLDRNMLIDTLEDAARPAPLWAASATPASW